MNSADAASSSSAVVIALLVIAFITYAVLVHRPASSSIDLIATKASPGSPSAVEAKPTPTQLPALRPTNDPETFAREVATALFAWDTATMIGRADHIEQPINVADPTGESTAGLLADIDNYLPTQDAWVDLAQYETK